jgi:C4-dicarboxylate transporter DctM subunit
MSVFLITFILLSLLLILLGLGVWVAFSLMTVAFTGLLFFTNAPVGTVMATTLWGNSHEWTLAALPLFIWMGEILFRTRLAQDLFTGLSPWLQKLPGGLLHVNIFGCGLFAAVSGSSAATAATVGKMTVPELQKRNYPEKMAIGTLAGSATLGFLIPPSIILIVYGVATEQSISRLFIAGIIPGFLLISLFAGYVIIWSLLNKSQIPPADDPIPFKQKIYQTRRLIPIFLLMIGVVGSMYTGLASPTDAAAVGVVLSLLISKASGTLSRKTFLDSLLGAVVTSCMISMIIAGASFLTVTMGFTGIPRLLASWITTLDLSVYSMLAALTVFFIIMGLFLDGISVVLLTTSVIMPMVEAVGIDILWFGVFLVVVVEMAQVTPPVGFNLFVLQGMTGKDIIYIAKAATPFFLLMVLMLVLLVVFPELATYLPQKMMS